MKALIRIASLCLVGLSSLIFLESASPLERQYSRKPLCDVENRIARDCMQFMGRARSKLECAARCTKDFLSTGYSVNGTFCYNHFFCAEVSGCTHENVDHVYYEQTESPCFNDGDWNAAMESCRCYDGWIGQFCEKRAKECRELYDWGYSTAVLVVYLDIPHSSQEWKVVCHRDTQYIRTYIFGNFGRISNNRTWDEYENGFFEAALRPIPNFFIGLRPLHLLRRAGLRELVIGVSFWNTVTNRQQTRISGAIQIMEDADIKDDSKFYEIDFKSVTLQSYGAISNLLTQHDCMTPVKKCRFSTWDMYQHAGHNHAVTSGAGWWFSETGSPCSYLGEHCSSIDQLGNPQCVHVDGIDNNLFINQLRFTRLFFRELI